MHGAIVYGNPRLGKATASRWCLMQLQGVMGRVPWLEVPLRNQRLATEREFFQHVLYCAKHRQYAQGTGGDRRDRLAKWMIERARRSAVNAMVLMVSEAQQLTTQHLHWLLNLDNELDMRGLRLFCLLEGQPALKQKKVALIEEGFEEIIGRFMLPEHQFTGLCSEDEVRDVLQQFDVTEYPLGSGQSFVANFIPLAVDGGFKLASVAPAAWAEVSAVSRKEGLKDVMVPMAYLTMFVTGLLMRLSEGDHPTLVVSPKSVELALAATHFHESARIRHIASTQPAARRAVN